MTLSLSPPVAPCCAAWPPAPSRSPSPRPRSPATPTPSYAAARPRPRPDRAAGGARRRDHTRPQRRGRLDRRPRLARARLLRQHLQRDAAHRRARRARRPLHPGLRRRAAVLADPRGPRDRPLPRPHAASPTSCGPRTPSATRFLSPGIPTVPDVLGPLGYTTGLIGKWHLTETYSGPYARAAGQPLRARVRRRAAQRGAVHRRRRLLPPLRLHAVGRGPRARRAPDRPAGRARRSTSSPTTPTSRSSCTCPTTPSTRASTRKPDLVAKYEAKPGADDAAPTHRPALAAMLESVDDQVGAVVDALRELGIADHTLVVVISDNGGQYRAANRAAARRQGRALRGRHPGADGRHLGRRTGAPGRTDATLVSTIDVLPTALDLAGGPPAAAGDRFDGISLAALLDRPGRARRRPTTRCSGSTRTTSAAPTRTPRSAPATSSSSSTCATAAVELYDLARDPGETTDLARPAGRHPPAADGCWRTTCATSRWSRRPRPRQAYPVAEATLPWDRGRRAAVPAGASPRRRPSWTTGSGHRDPGAHLLLPLARRTLLGPGVRGARAGGPSTPAASSDGVRRAWPSTRATTCCCATATTCSAWAGTCASTAGAHAGAEPLTTLDGRSICRRPARASGSCCAAPRRRRTPTRAGAPAGSSCSPSTRRRVRPARPRPAGPHPLRRRRAGAGPEITLGPLVAGRGA